jgi:FlaG/FlaF family flagellin (archaellin)
VSNGRLYFYVVTAVDNVGNESDRSNEAEALPHLVIGWANLQWPPSIDHTISALDPTENIYGQVWIDGYTYQPGPTEGLVAQVGYGPDGSDPDGNRDWIWVEAPFNVDAGSNDEFYGQLLPEAVGIYDYAYRYSTTAGVEWLYADLDGTGNGYDPAQAGDLIVNPSSDTTPPAAPLVLAPATEYTDWNVTNGASYAYVVLAVDTSFNQSGYSNEVEASAQARTVQVTFNATLPGTTPDGDDIYMAGSFNGWDPAGTLMVRTGLLSTVTLTFDEGVQLEYKYTRGRWDYVEKGAACEEIGNRTVNVVYGSDGTLSVDDTVLNWRNTAPCGD